MRAIHQKDRNGGVLNIGVYKTQTTPHILRKGGVLQSDPKLHCKSRPGAMNRYLTPLASRELIGVRGVPKASNGLTMPWGPSHKLWEVPEEVGSLPMPLCGWLADWQ